MGWFRNKIKRYGLKFIKKEIGNYFDNFLLGLDSDKFTILMSSLGDIVGHPLSPQTVSLITKLRQQGSLDNNDLDSLLKLIDLKEADKNELPNKASIKSIGGHKSTSADINLDE